MPSPIEEEQRRRQILGMVVLALIALAFTLLRAGWHAVFLRGWWRP